MNKEQQWYIQAGFKFSILWVGLLFLLSIFEVTRIYVPVVVLIFIAMWCITLINVWIFKDEIKKQTR